MFISKNYNKASQYIPKKKELGEVILSPSGGPN